MPKGREKCSGNTNSLPNFDPNKLGREDRFLFNLKEADEKVMYNFMIFIVQLRCYAALGGLKFVGEKLNEKLCLGDADSYKTPFMIVSVCYEGSYEIGFLIYKPNVYNIGFCINGNWWSTSDFSEVSNYTFTDSDALPYDSSYKKGIPTRFSFYVFQNSIINVYTKNDQDSYEALCVILCETMRSDEILRAVAGSLGTDINGVRKMVTLSAKHTNIIANWNHTCGLWYLYDLGFKWDPLRRYPELIFQDADACAESLGLAMKPDQKFARYIENLRKLSREERKEKKMLRRPVPLEGFEEDNADFEASNL